MESDEKPKKSPRELARELETEIAFLETDLFRAADEDKQPIRDAIAKKRSELERIQGTMN